MNATLALGKRSLREAIRQPDALFMTMFIRSSEAMRSLILDD